MPKTRAYTRKELETLRRGNLQNLFKIHGLKGANQKSDVLVDQLVSYFASPAFRAASPSSPRPMSRQHKALDSQTVKSMRPGAAMFSRAPLAKTRPVPLKAVEDILADPPLDKVDDPEPKQNAISIEEEEVEPAVRASHHVNAGPVTAAIHASSSSSPSLNPQTPHNAIIPPLTPPLTPTTALSTQLRALSERMDSLDARSSGASASISRSEFDAVRAELQAITETHTKNTGAARAIADSVDELAVMEMLNSRDRAWQETIRKLEEDWEARMEALFAEVNEKFEALETWLKKHLRRVSTTPGPSQTSPHAIITQTPGPPPLRFTGIPRFVPSHTKTATATSVSSQPPSTLPVGATLTAPLITLGKRRDREGNDAAAPDEQGDVARAAPELEEGSPTKKARTEGATQAGGVPLLTTQSSDPRTPSPPKASGSVFKTPDLPASASHGGLLGEPNPRTPSPSFQGLVPDNSRTPSVGADFFAHPPSFAPTTTGRQRRGSRGPIEQLPYPLFATTPKPSEPRSPTLDAPPSASRGRSNQPEQTMLTPGKRKAEPIQSAPRAVSRAHMDLSTITEGSGSEGESSKHARKPAQILFLPIEPTALERELYIRTTATRTPPPRLSPSPSITERPPSVTASPTRDRSIINIAEASGLTARSSPSRDFMDVALHGLPSMSDSPAGRATPGHRTMLGTERYLDTRFGDIPVAAWGSPTMYYGLGSTPRPSGQR